MSIILAQVTLAPSTGVPADEIVTTFHYEDTSGNPSSNLNIIGAAVDTFYSTLGVYISALASTTAGAHETKFYNLDDPEPRQPIGTEPFTISPGGTPLPPEVACCLSYRGDYVSGQANARRRGRFYVGPLASSTLIGATFTQQFLDDLCDAGQTMFQNIRSLANSCDPVVWSPTGQTATPITSLWVDNAVDIQRRRGRTATLRETRPVN